MGHRGLVAAAIGLGLLSVTVLPLQGAAAQSTPPGISRLGVRVISDSASATVEGSLFAVDATGEPVADLRGVALDARLDGKPVQLTLSGPRPSIAT